MTKSYPIAQEWLQKWNGRAVDSAVEDLLAEIASLDEMVHDALDGFCRNTRGQPADDSFMLEEATKASETTGHIHGTFDEVYHYGCRDMDGSDIIEAIVQFSIDTTNFMLTLEWKERHDDTRDSDDL